MKNKTKFKTGDIVNVDGVIGIILDVDTTLAQAPEVDYLVKPIDPKEMILGQWELGAGWVMESDIEMEEDRNEKVGG